jgi:hypothetical protein
LAKNAKVKARLEELLAEKANLEINIQAQARAEAAKAAGITASSLIEEAEQARALAMQNGQISAAVSAIREKAVLSGNRLERRDISVSGVDNDVSQLSNEELRDFLTEHYLDQAEKLGLDLETALLVDFIEAQWQHITDTLIDPPESDPTRGRRMPWDPRPQFLSGPPKRPRPKVIDGQVIIPEPPPRPAPRQLSAPTRPVDWSPPPKPVVDPKARKSNGIPADSGVYDNRRPR